MTIRQVNSLFKRGWRFILLLALLGLTSAWADQVVYDDALENGWSDWTGSWSTVNWANPSPVHSGTKSIQVTFGAWGGLYFHNSTFDPSGYSNLVFWVNGGSSGGQKLRIQAVANGSSVSGGIAFVAPTNSWLKINATMTNLVPVGLSAIDGFWIQDTTGGSQPSFYVDDFTLQTGPPPVPVTNTVVAVRVDAQANRHAINPLIYGVAFASSNELSELNFTLNRSGGNSETRYNWLINAHNLGNDWYFESYPDGSATPGASADDFVTNSLAGKAQPMISVPMIGWMPKLGGSRAVLPSFSVAKYGAQTSTDPWNSDAGNGVLSATGANIVNDPTDANFSTNSAFQKNFVQHLISRWGASTNGGVRYYIMDNEHSIWHSTHRDVHPVGATMQEIRDKIVDYGSMVKSNDPNAVVCGPEEWGWSGYFYSGYDQQWSGKNGYDTTKFPDRLAHGGMDYMPWLLNQMYQYQTNTGKRLLDYFTLHCYPQGNEYGNDISVATQTLRNQSTRQLWDTNYVDQSWISDKVMLIPRMKAWVTNYYPGTKTGITEYNWGAEAYMNGATAQADVLGIFGREGLDLGTRWTTPDTNTPTFRAMKLYRNYDGNLSTFGDTSVAATVPNPDNLAVFAAVRTNDNALTVMVINKTLSGYTPLQLNVTNFSGTGTAQMWRLATTNNITRLADLAYAGGVVTNVLPAQSITLLVLPAANTFQLRVGTNAPAAHQLELWADGQAGHQFFVQSSTNLLTWKMVSTNTFTSNSFHLLLSTTNGPKLFYRGLSN